MASRLDLGVKFYPISLEGYRSQGIKDAKGAKTLDSTFSVVMGST